MDSVRNILHNNNLNHLGNQSQLYLVGLQTGMSAVPCGIRVNSMILGYLDHENPGDPRKSGPEPWPLKMGPVGGAKNKMYGK